MVPQNLSDVSGFPIYRDPMYTDNLTQNSIGKSKEPENKCDRNRDPIHSGLIYSSFTVILLRVCILADKPQNYCFCYPKKKKFNNSV